MVGDLDCTHKVQNLWACRSIISAAAFLARYSLLGRPFPLGTSRNSWASLTVMLPYGEGDIGNSTVGLHGPPLAVAISAVASNVPGVESVISVDPSGAEAEVGRFSSKEGRGKTDLYGSPMT